MSERVYVLNLYCWNYMIRAVSERTPRRGERGCLIFFVSFSGKLISFHFLFWAKKSATGPFMEMRRMPHGHEISFRDMGRMEGEEGGRMYSLEYKTTILFFFEPIKLRDDERRPRPKKHLVCTYISRNTYGVSRSRKNILHKAFFSRMHITLISTVSPRTTLSSIFPTTHHVTL